MKTPYFLINEQELVDNINCFKNALEKNWNNSIIAYSIKTNSLPWLLKFIGSSGAYAEAVSFEEYQLAKMCGFSDDHIVLNGPIKSVENVSEAIKNRAIVNIDSEREIEYIETNRPDISNNLGIRLNIDPGIFSEKDAEYREDGFRFGFADINGGFENTLKRVETVYGHKKFGLHLHCNTITRSVEAYYAIAEYASEIIKKYELEPGYIDIGGGFFGGVPGKPTANDYIKVIRSVFENVVDPKKTTLIVEPGSAIVGSVFDFYTSVVDAKDNLKTRIVTTDGSRINIDPLWIKSHYLYSLEQQNGKNEMLSDQIICGYTCMDHDRIMRLKDSPRLEVGDKIIYHKVGNYTTTFGGMFIRYLPEVYVKHINGEIEKVRNRTSVEEYFKINSGGYDNE